MRAQTAFLFRLREDDYFAVEGQSRRVDELADLRAGGGVFHLDIAPCRTFGELALTGLANAVRGRDILTAVPCKRRHHVRPVVTERRERFRLDVAALNADERFFARPLAGRFCRDGRLEVVGFYDVAVRMLPIVERFVTKLYRAALSYAALGRGTFGRGGMDATDEAKGRGARE